MSRSFGLPIETTFDATVEPEPRQRQELSGLVSTPGKYSRNSVPQLCPPARPGEYQTSSSGLGSDATDPLAGWRGRFREPLPGFLRVQEILLMYLAAPQTEAPTHLPSPPSGGDLPRGAGGIIFGERCLCNAGYVRLRWRWFPIP